MFRSPTFSILVVLSASLTGGEPKTDSLDRHEAVERALSANRDLIAARLALEQARARTIDAGKPANPEVRLGGLSDFASGGNGEYGWSISLEQRFPITARLRLLREIASEEVVLAGAEIREAERRIAHDVESVLDAIIAADARILLLQEQIELNEGLASFLAMKVERAEASPFDVAQLRLTIQSTRQARQREQRDREDLLSKLRERMGADPGERIELRSTGPSPDIGDPLPELTAAEIGQNPSRQYLERLGAIASRQASLAQAGRWGDLAAGILFEQEQRIDEPDGLKRDQFLGLSLTIPLPLHDSNRGDLEEARAGERRIARELEALDFRLHHEAGRLQRRHQSLYQQIKDYESGVIGAAEDNLRQMEEAYAAGLIDLTALFRVRDQHLELQITLLELRSELQTAVTDWRFVSVHNLHLQPARHDRP